MRMDETHARDLLPCFVCGDLTPAMSAQVQALVDASPRLTAEVAALRGAEDACRQLMDQLADELPGDLLDGLTLDLAPSTSDRSRSLVPALQPWRSLFAAAAALFLVVGTAAGLGSLTPPLDGLPERHVLLAPAQDPTFIAQTNRASLRTALIDAGVAPGLALVPDLEDLGLHLVGGQAGKAGPGAVLVYEGDGQRYVCQIFSGSAPTDAPVAVKDAAGTYLRGFQLDDLAVVVWESHGMFCMFSGQTTADQLLAMIAKRYTTG